MILFISLLLQSKTIKKSVPKKIEHQRQFGSTWELLIRAPTKGGSYVCYTLIKYQSNCNKVVVNPQENFDYCTDEHKEELIEIIQKFGLSLIKNY